MKRLLIFLMLIPILAIGQNIEQKINPFTGKQTIQVDREFILKDGDRGLFIIPTIGSGGRVSLHVQTVGINDCNQFNELRFLFADGSSIFRKSITGFRCDGVSIFQISRKDGQKFLNSEIVAIRFKNGRSHERIEVLDVDDSDYFMIFFKNKQTLGL